MGIFAQIGMATAVSLVLAVLLPLVLIFVQHEVRIRRIRLIEEFRRNFFYDPKAAARAERAESERRRREAAAKAEEAREAEAPLFEAVVAETVLRSVATEEARRGRPKDCCHRSEPPTKSPSFEFVVTKYIIDLFDLCTDEQRETIRKEGASALSSKELYALVGRTRIWRVASNWYLLFAFLPYAITVTGITFFVLEGVGRPEVVALGDKDLPTYLAAGLLGATFFTLRLLIGSAINFDLTPRVPVRAFGQFVLVTVVMAVYGRIAPPLGEVTPATGWGQVQALWGLAVLAGAFVIGVQPEAGFQFVYTVGRQLAAKSPLRGVFALIKRTDNRFDDHVGIVPLEVLDGVDFGTRYRLEDVGLCDVQNLATANPILLHIETPYGIYQTVDWVAQAQLCTIAGLERFMIFQQFNIRTIFDLERMVLSRQSTHALRQFVGAILFTPNARLDAVLKAAAEPKSPARTLTPLPDPTRKTPLPDGFAATVLETVAEPADIEQEVCDEETCEPVWRAAGGVPDASIIHAVRVMVDDLHVHRLREIWERIGRSLGRDAEHLDDTVDAAPPRGD